MATTYTLPVRKRVKFACQYHYPTEADITAVIAIMAQKDPGFALLEPRPFGKLARQAIAWHWDTTTPPE